MDRTRFRPSPAFIIAVVALIVALSGGAYAATVVTGSQIKNNSVTGADIANNSISSADVRNGSLLLSDLSAGARNGLAGATGPAGPPGRAGSFDPARLVYVTSPEGFAPPGGASNRVAATCPAGGRVIGGGFWTGSDVNVYASAPSATRTEWVVYGQHVGSIPAPIGVYAYAICAMS